MLKFKSFILFFLLLASMSQAREVTYTEALNKASEFASHINRTLVDLDDKGSYYYAKFSPSGYAVVSKDTEMIPIKAFSLSADIATDWGKYLEAVTFQTYEAVKKEGLRSFKAEKAWLYNIKSTPILGGYDVEKEPLLNTIWDQNQYTSKYTPIVDGEMTPAGCVAVAMGQIMNYWQFPDKGVGSISYLNIDGQNLSASFDYTFNWSLMPKVTDSTVDQTSLDEAAYLLKLTGFAAETRYSPEVSTSTIMYAAQALNKYFKYDNKLDVITRQLYNESDFESILKNERLLDRPVFISLSVKNSDIGHAGVIDGYREIDGITYFHFNLGLGGEGDAYYAMNDFELEFDGQLYEVDPEEAWAIVYLEPSDEENYGLWNSFLVSSVLPIKLERYEDTYQVAYYRDNFEKTDTIGISIVMHKWDGSTPVTLSIYDSKGEEVDSYTFSSYNDGMYYADVEDFLGVYKLSSGLEEGTYKIIVSSLGKELRTAYFSIGSIDNEEDNNDESFEETDNSNNTVEKPAWKKLRGTLDNSAYWTVPYARDWARARDYCASYHSAHLVVINSQEENDYIAKLAKEANFDEAYESSIAAIWIGYSDYQEEGVWSWIVGDSDYTNWEEDYPDINDFAVMMLDEADFGKWRSVCIEPDCMKLPFICEKEEENVNPPSVIEIDPFTHGEYSNNRLIATIPHLLYNKILIAQNVKLVQTEDDSTLFSLEDFDFPEAEIEVTELCASISESDVWTIYIPYYEFNQSLVAKNIYLKLESPGKWRLDSYELVQPE